MAPRAERRPLPLEPAFLARYRAVLDPSTCPWPLVLPSHAEVGSHLGLWYQEALAWFFVSDHCSEGGFGRAVSLFASVSVVWFGTQLP